MGPWRTLFGETDIGSQHMLTIQSHLAKCCKDELGLTFQVTSYSISSLLSSQRRAESGLDPFVSCLVPICFQHSKWMQWFHEFSTEFVY